MTPADVRPRWVVLGWLTVGILALLMVTACRRGGSDIDTAPQPSAADGTLSGTVRGSAGVNPIDGRRVEVVNVDTGERQRATTNVAGGFSFRLRPGKYRVELALRDGESLIRQPGVIDLDRSEADTQAHFVVGSVRVSRPRGPAYRMDDGLGSPIA